MGQYGRYRLCSDKFANIAITSHEVLTFYTYCANIEV